MLANISGKQYECAKATGYSRWQISRIVNSRDFGLRFEACLAQRRAMVIRRMFQRS
jgi:hypothetical protein